MPKLLSVLLIFIVALGAIAAYGGGLPALRDAWWLILVLVALAIFAFKA